ncbi:MAG TPA: class I SAM-dependent methyltransferase [Egibacteraceae bacterium]
MTTTQEPTPAAVDALDESRRDALAERLFAGMLSGLELLAVELGRRLDLYAILHEQGTVDTLGLASAAGIAPRYAREWLEQQAVAGVLDVVADDDDADRRRYALPAASAAVVLDPDSPAYLGGASMALLGVALTLEKVVDAFRSGGGVAYRDFGDNIRDGIAMLNRPVYRNDLAQWLETLPDVQERLSRGGAVLDVGCGSGWSTIELARALPQATITGIDMDEASIAAARRNAVEAGVDVTFEVGDAAGLTTAQRVDLVTFFEALHDLGEPVQALARARACLTPGGAVLVADERVAPAFTAPGDELERLNYAYSVLHCLPATMDESTAVANGTVLREPTVRAWAAEAGYRRVDVLPIDNDLWRFYRLWP